MDHGEHPPHTLSLTHMRTEAETSATEETKDQRAGGQNWIISTLGQYPQCLFTAEQPSLNVFPSYFSLLYRINIRGLFIRPQPSEAALI